MALGSNMKSGSSKSKGLVKKITETGKKPISEKEAELKDASLSLEPSRRKKIRKTKVKLEGQLTIQNVASFREKIAPIFESYDYVDFHLTNVTALDLSYVQLLYFFKEKYGGEDKQVTIDSELSGGLKKIVVHAGFEELIFKPKLV